MRKMCAKMVPKNLTTEQKANRRDVCLDLLGRLEREPEFFSRVITGDETWSLEHNPDTKRQSRGWHTANSPRPKKTRMSKSKIKSMLICFFFIFDSQGIVHKEFVPPGQTVNQTFYREVLERLRKRVARVRPGIECTWMLHHDNAPCHTAVKGIPAEAFQHSYEQWKQRLRRCVAAQGNYFEGNNLDL